MLEEENKLDQEWINLMKEAYQLGLTIVEIKKFIHSNQKSLFLDGEGSVFLKNSSSKT